MNMNWSKLSHIFTKNSPARVTEYMHNEGKKGDGTSTKSNKEYTILVIRVKVVEVN